jgi:uncharacterized membrane protein YjjB (DUF3815 family)
MGLELLFAFSATVAYGILFNVPPKAVIGGGVIGMIGWLIVSLLARFWSLSAILSVLIASVLVALLSQLLAKWFRLPSTTFSIAGIIPLVPGAMAYRTMRSFVDGNYPEAIALAAETMLIAGAIAAGLMISLAIFSLWKGMSWRDGVKFTSF